MRNARSRRGHAQAIALLIAVLNAQRDERQPLPQHDDEGDDRGTDPRT